MFIKGEIEKLIDYIGDNHDKQLPKSNAFVFNLNKYKECLGDKYDPCMLYGELKAACEKIEDVKKRDLKMNKKPIVTTLFFKQNMFDYTDDNLEKLTKHLRNAMTRLSYIPVKFIDKIDIETEVYGYASSEGGEEYNFSLSEKRIQNIIDMLNAAHDNFEKLNLYYQSPKEGLQWSSKSSRTQKYFEKFKNSISTYPRGEKDSYEDAKGYYKDRKVVIKTSFSKIRL